MFTGFYYMHTYNCILFSYLVGLYLTCFVLSYERHHIHNKTAKQFFMIIIENEKIPLKVHKKHNFSHELSSGGAEIFDDVPKHFLCKLSYI